MSVTFLKMFIMITVILIGLCAILLSWVLSKTLSLTLGIFKKAIIVIGWGVLTIGGCVVYSALSDRNTEKVEAIVDSIDERVDTYSERIVQKMQSIDFSKAKDAIDRISDKVINTVADNLSDEPCDEEEFDDRGLPCNQFGPVEQEWSQFPDANTRIDYKSVKIDGEMMVFQKMGDSWVKCKYVDGDWVIE